MMDKWQPPPSHHLTSNFCSMSFYHPSVLRPVLPFFCLFLFTFTSPFLSSSHYFSLSTNIPSFFFFPFYLSTFYPSSLSFLPSFLPFVLSFLCPFLLHLFAYPFLLILTLTLSIVSLLLKVTTMVWWQWGFIGPHTMQWGLLVAAAAVSQRVGSCCTKFNPSLVFTLNFHILLYKSSQCHYMRIIKFKKINWVWWLNWESELSNWAWMAQTGWLSKWDWVTATDTGWMGLVTGTCIGVLGDWDLNWGAWSLGLSYWDLSESDWDWRTRTWTEWPRD